MDVWGRLQDDLLLREGDPAAVHHLRHAAGDDRPVHPDAGVVLQGEHQAQEEGGDAAQHLTGGGGGGEEGGGGRRQRGGGGGTAAARGGGRDGPDGQGEGDHHHSGCGVSPRLFHIRGRRPLLSHHSRRHGQGLSGQHQIHRRGRVARDQEGRRATASPPLPQRRQ